MAIEKFNGGTVVTGGHIAVYQLLVWKSAVGLEAKGIKVHRRSVTAMVKRHFGWKGNASTILTLLEAEIAKRKREADAEEAAKPCPECERSNGPNYRGPCTH